LIGLPFATSIAWPIVAHGEVLEPHPAASLPVGAGATNTPNASVSTQASPLLGGSESAKQIVLLLQR
jgi:hypothetical protein